MRGQLFIAALVVSLYLLFITVSVQNSRLQGKINSLEYSSINSDAIVRQIDEARQTQNLPALTKQEPLCLWAEWRVNKDLESRIVDTQKNEYTEGLIVGNYKKIGELRITENNPVVIAEEYQFFLKSGYTDMCVAAHNGRVSVILGK